MPAYNASKTLKDTYEEIPMDIVDEVVVVDDGSIDNTVQVAEYAGATVLKHGGNKGYGAAIQSCFKYARENDFDILTILDGDGQHDAQEIPTVMTPVLEKKVDVCIGSRFVNNNGGHIPMHRRFGIGLLTRITNTGSGKTTTA